MAQSLYRKIDQCTFRTSNNIYELYYNLSDIFANLFNFSSLFIKQYLLQLNTLMSGRRSQEMICLQQLKNLNPSHPERILSHPNKTRYQSTGKISRQP